MMRNKKHFLLYIYMNTPICSTIVVKTITKVRSKIKEVTVHFDIQTATSNHIKRY